MSDPMAEIRASFFIECEELLEGLQDALQEMEGGAAADETINVAFRAVHSIKGGAGAFGLDALVSFAHSFETAMDDVRSGRLEAGADVVALFFQCGDMLSDLVRVSRDGGDVDGAVRDRLLSELAEISAGNGENDESDEPAVEFQPMGISLDLEDGGLPPLSDLSDGEDEDLAREGDAGINAMRRVEILFTPEPELYRSGNEPLFLLRALKSLGTTAVACELPDLPDLSDLTPESSILSWRVILETNVDDQAIGETFDFVEGLCKLTIEEVSDPDIPDDREIPRENPATPPSVEPVEAGPAGAPDLKTIRAVPAAASRLAPEVPGDPAEDFPPANKDSEATSASVQAQSQGKPGATVRVDLDRIDRLVNLVGELVINQAMLSQSVAAAGFHGNTKIASGLDEFQQLTRDIQDSVMMIRAQPVKSLFQRMSRIVREASNAVGKTVRLRTEGEGTEIDKTVIERLSDPLTHMIRNAVDHGLESTEARIAAGKPAEGRVTLAAYHRSGRVVIEVGDDGGGINRQKVRQIAIDKGLVPADQELTDTEVDNLLFLPGFSTASEISNLSGRGVGMDVVKNAISSLGGRISIASTAGIGTTFSISLPLTLAVLDGMVVRVRNETLVVPLSAISETLSLEDGDARSLGPNTHVVRVRDSFVPLIDLGTELGYAEPRMNYKGAIVLLISQEDGSRAALVVDGIEDQRQVVIKGLQDSYGHVPGVAAATILGDGQIALILDPVDLLNNASGMSRPDRLTAAE